MLTVGQLAQLPSGVTLTTLFAQKVPRMGPRSAGPFVGG